MNNNRVIIWVIISSFIGAVLLFPPTIPMIWTIQDNPLLTEFVLVGFPLLGAIIGGISGGLISSKRISLPNLDDKLLKFFLMFLIIIVVIGIELGFLFSPVVFIGLGNTSTNADMWIFPICTGTATFLLAMIIGNIILLIRFIYRNTSGVKSS